MSRLPAKKKPEPPIGGLMDRRFVYVPAAATDIRETFKRARALIPSTPKVKP